MQKSLINGVNVLLCDPVFNHCLTHDLDALLSLSSAFFKPDAENVTVLPSKLGGAPVNAPGTVFVIDDAFLASVAVVRQEAKANLALSALQYSIDLRTSFASRLPVRTLFILEHGDPFPEDGSPLSEVARLSTTRDEASIDVRFLCLEKLRKGADFLPSGQREWGFFLRGDSKGEESKDKGIRAMAAQLVRYPKEEYTLSGNKVSLSTVSSYIGLTVEQVLRR